MADTRKDRNNLLVLMGLSFVTGLAVIPVVFVIYQLVSIAQAISIENAFATQRLQLSDHVWLLATGGTGVMLADKDEFGLVYGDVVMAGYTSADKQTLMVVYTPYSRHAEDSDDALGIIKAAEVDLATGQVTERPAVTKGELADLQGIFAFMNYQ